MDDDVEVISWKSSAEKSPTTSFLKGPQSVWASLFCCCLPSGKKKKIYVPKTLFDMVERKDYEINYKNAHIEGQRIAYEQRIVDLTDILNGLLSEEFKMENSNLRMRLREALEELGHEHAKILEEEGVDNWHSETAFHGPVLSETKLIFDPDALCMRREFSVKNVEGRRIVCDLYANEKYLKLVVFPNWRILEVDEEMSVQVTCYGHREGGKKWTTVVVDSASVPDGATGDHLTSGLLDRRRVQHREILCVLK